MRMHPPFVYSMRLAWALRLLTVLGCALGLSACATQADLTTLTRPYSIEPEVYKTGPLHLAGWHSVTQPSQPLLVIIEGDGRPWLASGRVAQDPTPIHAVGLTLALAYKGPNILYLARPCQFGARQTDSACQNSAWWTDQRYSPTVITSVINTINQHRQPGQEVILSGYSGGATIAVGAALQLEKVRGLVTVAGNLNVHGLNDYHQVQFMPEAFDPSQHITDLMHIPQRHYIGLDDAVVPPHLSEQFAQQLPLAEMVKLPDVSHTQGWFKQTIDFTFN